MKKKQVISIIMLVVLVCGIALLAIGVYSQSLYDQATEMLGCKKPDTMSYVLAPETITSVVSGQDPAKLKKFLTGTLGLSAEEVDKAIGERDLLVQKQAEVKTRDAISAYARIENPDLTDEDITELIKDKSRSDPMREEMLKASVMEALNLDEAGFEKLAADESMVELFQKGFPAFRNGGFLGFVFNNGITCLFLGIALTVFSAAYFLIGIIASSKGRGKAHIQSPKQQKITEILLNYALYFILFVILAVVCVIKPNFLDVSNLLNIVKQTSTKGILALGCAGLIVLAGTDLSIGRVLGLSAAVTASLVQSVDYASRMFPQITTPFRGIALLVPLLASIAVACIFTMINGFGVSKLHLHAFIVTLGTQLIAQGCTCIYIESQPSGTAQALSTFDRNAPGSFLDVAAGSLELGSTKIPLVAIYFIVLAIIMWFIWNKTKLGKNMFAVGGNEEAASVSGVNVAKTIMLVYLIAGILYGISAFLEAARITSCGANTGLNYETDAISACVVGGVSFSGGVGTIQGVVIGALVLQAINYALQFLGVNPYLQYIIRGLIIILAVSIDVRKYLVKK